MDHDELPDADPVLDAVQALRRELQAVRNTQLRMMKALLGLKHDTASRLATTREEVGALIKASHADLSERLGELDAFVDEHHQRIEDIESDFDALIDGRS